MPEGAPNQESNIESFSKWRELRELAPEQAEVELQKFEGVHGEELFAAVQERMQELAEEGNENRFLVREMARQLRIAEIHHAHHIELESLTA